jgi:hypothetical protein
VNQSSLTTDYADQAANDDRFAVMQPAVVLGVARLDVRNAGSHDDGNGVHRWMDVTVI